MPFHVTGFVAAVLGAIVVGVVSWLLNLLIKDKREKGE